MYATMKNVLFCCLVCLPTILWVSTWFLYIDRYPQKYVGNIYKDNAEDLIKSEIRVNGSSVVEIGSGEKLNTRFEPIKKCR